MTSVEESSQSLLNLLIDSGHSEEDSWSYDSQCLDQRSLERVRLSEVDHEIEKQRKNEIHSLSSNVAQRQVRDKSLVFIPR